MAASRVPKEGREKMTTQIRTEPLRIPRRRDRGFLLWLVRIVAGLLGLAVVGAVWESVSEAADVRAYPPPGQMVDVDGYRLHIDCTGIGSPTVVIDAGWGAWSASWMSWVPPGVANTTRVCTYDRAGMGYSEAGPLPRNAERFAKELHTLLHQASIPGPYVLVGHSLGGLTARVFAHRVFGGGRGSCVRSNRSAPVKPSHLSRMQSRSRPRNPLGCRSSPCQPVSD